MHHRSRHHPERLRCMLSVAARTEPANNKDLLRPARSGRTLRETSITRMSVRPPSAAWRRNISVVHVRSFPRPTSSASATTALNPDLAADFVVNTVIKQYIDHTLAARIEASANRISGQALREARRPEACRSRRLRQEVLDLQKRPRRPRPSTPAHNQITDEPRRSLEAPPPKRAKSARILAESRATTGARTPPILP